MHVMICSLMLLQSTPSEKHRHDAHHCLSGVDIKLPQGITDLDVIEQLRSKGFLKEAKRHKALNVVIKKLLKDRSSWQNDSEHTLQELFSTIIMMGATVTNLPPVSMTFELIIENKSIILY